MNDLEIKWKTQWKNADHGKFVLGVSFFENGWRAAIVKNGQNIIVPFSGLPRNDFESNGFTEALRIAFIMHAAKESAEKLLKEPVSDVVVGVTGDNDQRKIKLYRDAAEIAGMNLLYVGADATMAALAIGKETQTSCKCAVFVANNTTCSVGIYDIGDGVFEVKSRRGREAVKIDEITGVIERMYRDALDEAELNEVDKVFLVGSMANVAHIIDTVERIAEMGVSECAFSDDAIAIGAALKGAINVGNVNDVMLLDVLPRTLGIELAGKMTPIVVRDTTIPTKKTVRLPEKDFGTGRLSLNIYEGDSVTMSDNHVIQSISLDDDIRAKLGGKNIEVVVDVDGRLGVKVDLKGSKGVLSCTRQGKDTRPELETTSEHVSHEKCGHCHGEGHTECHTCHGKKTEECPTCHGKKDVKCSKCGGHGHFPDCKTCYSTGKVDCNKCGGTGKIHERCPNCLGSRRVQKTRLRTCSNCHGRGEVKIPMPNGQWRWERCSRCNGNCQVEERYSETCPTCGGTGRSPYEITCPKCNGRKEFTCSRCHGTRHAECSACSGTGKVTCGECYGKGEITCRDCNGGGDHVCVDCYGTGENSRLIKAAVSEGNEKASNAVRLSDPVESFKILRSTAEEFCNPLALRFIGRMYDQGIGFYRDYKKANVLYRVSANAGDIESLVYLGRNYLSGSGAECSKSEARRLLEIASKKGCKEAPGAYKTIVTARLKKEPISGVVGWQSKFEIPDFVMGDGPIEEMRRKVAEEIARKEEAERREAARKAEEARKERGRKRKIRNINLCRGLWWLLFRVAAATAFFTCLKDSYKDIPENDLTMLAVGFFLASYIIRPKFGGVCYFFVGLLLPIAAVVHNSTNPMASFCLFTVMVTFFMRWMGEKLKLPLITYPVLGAMVGFCTSPFAISHNVFNVTPWWFSTMGLAILFFLVNLGMSGNNGTGVVVKGERKTSWLGTFVLLGVCALVTGYIATSVSGEVYRFSWTPSAEKDVAERSGGETGDVKARDKKMTDCERGICYRDGNGVAKDVVQAKACFAKAIKAGDHEAEYHLANILIEEGDVWNGEKLLDRGVSAGYAPAICRLGELRLKDKKEEDAMRLFKVAAEKDSVEAMLHLGAYYAEKTGIFGGRRDKDLAIRYYTMAGDKGNAKAKEQLKAIGE